MSLLFADSFDHYTDILTKWDTKGDDTILLNTGDARTGIGCVKINSGAEGPGKTFGHIPVLLCATNSNCNGAGCILRIAQFDAPPRVGQDATLVSLWSYPDRSVSANAGFTSNLAFSYGASAAGIIQFNTYNSVALRVKVHPTAGTVAVWVNGVKVVDVTGVQTTFDAFPTDHYANGFAIMGPGSVPLCFHDDVYVLDCTVTPNDDFLGALRIYAAVPTADGAVQWTASPAGSNFANVAEIPPDGDSTYNFDDTVGQADQYQYPLTGVPANASIIAVQHVMDLRVDSGSREVSSDINGAVSLAGHALTSGYAQYGFPYDVNPATGVAWVAGDFPVFAGPKVTA